MENNRREHLQLRMKFLFGLILLLMVVYLLFSFFKVQILKHDFYLAQAQSRYTQAKKIQGIYGEIFDVNGYLLVGNSPRVNIICDPSNIRTPYMRRKLASICAVYLNHNFNEIYNKLAPTRYKRDSKGNFLKNPDGTTQTAPNRYQMLYRLAPLEVYDNFKAAIKANKIPSGIISYKDSQQRIYPKGMLLSNVLGYSDIVSDTNCPRTGLELQLADILSPQEGAVLYERMRDGTPLGYGLRLNKASHNGKNVYLTISEQVQAILEEELDAAFAKWQPDYIYAAIADPKTGNILALAQRPSFNPNDRSTFKPGVFQVKIAEDAYEPGSVVKPFSIGKALDWNVISKDDIFDCENGSWLYKGKILTDSHRYEKLSVGEIIQKSSNIGTAKVALLLGEDRVAKVLKNFGFGTKTNLPFPVEAKGRMVNMKRDKVAITRVPIGYGLSVSPLQLLRAYCALANNGNMPQLRLIDKIEDPETKEVEVQPYKPFIKTFDNPQALKELIKMMVSVTEKGGTATKAAIPGYEVAGKTGTSYKYIPKVGYSRSKAYASFIGFVPADDPKLVMVITMDSPKGSMYGGIVAARVFSKTCERVLRHFNIQPKMPEVTLSNSSTFNSTAKETSNLTPVKATTKEVKLVKVDATNTSKGNQVTRRNLRPVQVRAAQTRPAQTRPAQTRPVQTRPAQTRFKPMEW
jgi:cell division protein FtsI/penicillin-binding protein 2